MPSDEPQTPKFYLTTPIYYVNARPHIGHAYTTIVADVLARRHRLQGDDTFFLTGTDEHGQKIERSAAAAGIPPQQFADQVSAQFRALWDRMGLTYDRYIRTTAPAHKQGAQQLFRELYNRGYIYLSTYTGSYCVSDEAFVDLAPGTPCPDCGRLLETVTEENFFFKLSAFQLPLLNLIESNELLITPDTARNEVLSFLRGNTIDQERWPELWEEVGPGEYRTNEGLMRQHLDLRLKSGDLQQSATGAVYTPGALKDLSVSRSSFTWGIPVPPDVQQASGTTQNHVIYVWLDALANYMTAIGYGSDSPEAQAEFQRFWPADLHLVGKEITRFHCVYWPAFLLALNPKLQHDPKDRPPVLSATEHAEWAKRWVPKQITANGWLLFDNAKMSKSRGNVVRTETILDAFGDHVYGKQFPDSTKHERDLFAADVLRYFLLRGVRFGKDGSFDFERLVAIYNSSLANRFGNLVSRTLTLIHNAFGGVIPTPPRLEELSPYRSTLNAADPPTEDEQLREDAELIAELTASLADKDSYFLLGEITQVAIDIAQVDRFISDSQPWKLAKMTSSASRGALARVLYDAAESIRSIALRLHPVMPYSTVRVWDQLGLERADIQRQYSELYDYLDVGAPESERLQPGTKLGPLSPIFPRADKSLAQVMIDMEETRNTAPQTSTPRALTPEQNTPATTFKAAATPTPAFPVTGNSADPAAPPRTSSLDEPSGALTVGGSNAEAATLPTTPGPHTSAPASGPFATPATPETPQTITIDDFMKVELRVAQILVAERIPKADKLLRLEVDLGTERRQILSGIAQHYTPEELIGRRIVVVSNLAPRKMRGLDSHGMLLAASEGAEGKPILATLGEDIALGSRVR